MGWIKRLLALIQPGSPVDAPLYPSAFNAPAEGMVVIDRYQTGAGMRIVVKCACGNLFDHPASYGSFTCGGCQRRFT